MITAIYARTSTQQDAEERRTRWHDAVTSRTPTKGGSDGETWGACQGWGWKRAGVRGREKWRVSYLGLHSPTVFSARTGHGEGLLADSEFVFLDHSIEHFTTPTNEAIIFENQWR